MRTAQTVSTKTVQDQPSVDTCERKTWSELTESSNNLFRSFADRNATTVPDSNRAVADFTDKSLTFRMSVDTVRHYFDTIFLTIIS